MALFNRSGGVGVGIDLGTANIVVYQSDKGIVFDEPSCVAVRKMPRGGAEIIAYGHDAKSMVGKTPVGVSVIKPLRDGVIANFDMTEAVLRHFVALACQVGHFASPHVVVSVPAKVTEVERRAVVDAALGAGAREAYILDEPLAAALGAGLPIAAPEGSMVLDIGSGTSEVAVISLGGLVVNNSLRIAGDSMDEAIISLFRQKHALFIGESTAENVKIQIGSVVPLKKELEIEVKGRDLADGLPKVCRVSSVEVREALAPIISRIEDMVKVALEQTPPELSRDIVDNGIVLTGGASQLRGLPRRLTSVLNAPVILAEDPIHAVINGVGMTLQNMGDMKTILTTVHKSQM
ncbi:MAG: rod shape-determining protein [Pyramidobacter sp.]